MPRHTIAVIPPRLTLAVAFCLFMVAGCTGPSGPSDAVTVTAGTWRYVLNVNIGLPSEPNIPRNCAPPSVDGTTVVSSTGTFTIPFSNLSCSGCSLSGTIAGTVTPKNVSGSVTASTVGSGCGAGQPTPSPAAMTGNCTATGCSVSIGPTPASIVVNYTLTPP